MLGALWFETLMLQLGGVGVGVREHRASYLRTGSLAAHAGCEWGEVRTCEPPHSA